MMENTRKMVLVPPHVLDSLQRTNPTSPMQQQVNDLDEKMRSILDRADLNTHDKAQLYSQHLQNFLQATTSTKRPISIEVKDIKSGETEDALQPASVNEEQKPDPIELDVLRHIPRTYQNRASHLLQKIKADANVGWTASGQLTIRDKIIRGSNLCDLLYDIFRERRGYAPTGSEEFMQALAEMNVPETFVANPQRRHDLQRRKRETEVNTSQGFDGDRTEMVTVSSPASSTRKSKRKRGNKIGSPAPAWVKF